MAAGAPARAAAAWAPLLEGPEADAAREAALAIAEGIEALDYDLGPTVAGGWSGTALLHAYLAQAGLDAGAEDRARHDLRAAVAASRAGLDPSLFAGVTGVAWTVAHVAGRAQAQRSLGAVDAMLLERLSQPGWPGEFDAMLGVAGIAVYAIERLPDPVGHRLLDGVLERLAEASEPAADGGRTWAPPAKRALRGDAGEAIPSFDLGMAHGVAGVVAVLAAVVVADPARPDAAAMLDEAAEWLVRQAGPAGAQTRYAYRAVSGRPAVPARSAWCYGDPGVACALIAAARARGREDWEQEAVATGLAAARRAPEGTGVGDAGLCHGSVGLAHIFARLHAAHPDERFADAALGWYRRALSFRRPDVGIGGYVAMMSDGGRPVEMAVPGFLEGAAGTALGLLAAATPGDPGWDRLLLLGGAAAA